ncbi:DUF4190 domain-containing protein [Cellulomonas sp. URHD0024]|uniref:DUF4190 domain-containing protein n=1 Tax=Cellulomonas sp. URHD0024 TaxID=1302620 RepID=UPI00040ED18F|nr:DUF4190 domain-containing protein [Cellulomonas sp. URHD0024]
MTAPQQTPTSLASEDRDTSQNWFAVASLASGIVGLSIIAVPFGVLGLRAVRQGHATNRGLSIAGLVLGAVGVAAWAGAVALATSTPGRGNAVAAPAPTPAAGATRYVLTPTPGSDKALVHAAAVYLSSRIDDDAKVGTDGRSVLVVFPAPATAEQAASLVAGSGAQFRPVIDDADPMAGSGTVATPGSASTPSWPGDATFYVTADLAQAYTSTDCTRPAPAQQPAPDSGAVACAADGSRKYLLGGAPLTAADISAVSIDRNTVTYVLTREGEAALTNLTTQLASAVPPANQMAITADGLELSAAQVLAPIRGTEMQVRFPDEVAAQVFAGALTYGSKVIALEVTDAE